MAATPSPRTEAPPSLRAALVFQAVQLNDPLKSALAGAGIDVVFEGKADGINRSSLKDARPQVFVVNLDPDLEDHLDELTELLDEYDRPVIFNDAAASNTLSGWDQARWARHLAAKIRGEVDAHPPRPVGATLIASPPKPSPPPAALAAAPPPSPKPAAEPTPAPAVAATAVASAPAMAQPAAPEPRPTLQVAATVPQPESLLKSPAALASPPAIVPRNPPPEADLDAMFADFMSDTVPQSPVAPPKALNPTVEIPVVPPRATTAPGFERPAAVDEFELGFDTPAETAASQDSPVIAVDDDFGDFGDFGAAPDTATTALDGGWDSFGEASAPVPRLPTTDTDDFGASLDEAFSDFELPAAPARSTEELTDLDALFREMAPAVEPPAAAAPRAAPAAAPRAATASSEAPRKAAELKAPPMDWSLEPLDGEGLASAPAPAQSGRAQFALGADAKPVVPPPSAPAPAATAQPTDVGDADLAAFDFFFDDGGAPAPVAPPGNTAAPAPAKVNLDDIPDFGFALDPIGEPDAAAPVPAVHKPVPVVSAPAPAAIVARPVVPAVRPATPPPPAPVPAPVTARAAPTATAAKAAPEPGGFDFDFDNFGSTPAPSPKHDHRALEAAALADLDGLFADIEAPPVVADIPNLDRVWILGASIGGPEAVRAFLAGLKKNTASAFILAQHMGAEFLDLMISQLAKASPLPVKVARAGEKLQNGDVLVAPVGKRLTLDAQGRIQLGELPNDTSYSPSIDQIMFDMSDRFGPRCSAIIFSGMASDAIEGAKYIHSKGGRVWVQDPSTCVISSMIDGAQAAGVVNYVGSPEQLAEHLQAHLGNP